MWQHVKLSVQIRPWNTLACERGRLRNKLNKQKSALPVPPRERKIPGSNPACAGIFSGSSHTSDFKIGTQVATLPGAWRYRVSTGTGRPGVSILWLGEEEGLICNFYLSVAARKIVCADPSLRYTRLLLGRKSTNQQTPCSVAFGSCDVDVYPDPDPGYGYLRQGQKLLLQSFLFNAAR